MHWIGKVLVATCWLGPAVAAAKSPPDADLAYRFTLVRSPAVSVRVELQCQASDSSATWLGVSRDWGGVDTGGDDLANAAAWGADGEALVTTHPDPNRWCVQQTPGAVIRFTYEIPANTNQASSHPKTSRRPVVNDHLFHTYGKLGLVRPLGRDDTAPCRVTATWSDFDAAGWTVATSFGVGTRPHKFTTTLTRLCSSVWMAGDVDLVRRSIKGRPLWVAIQRAPWTFETSEFADMAQTIVRMEREFFTDYDTPFFLVTLIPVGAAGSGSQSLGGTGLTNSFSLAMLPDTPLRGDFGHDMNIASLLAHEMFHQWDGHTIMPANPEELCYWFTEGFTDFYMRRLLYRNGLASDADFAAHVNKKLADLWTTSVRNAPNEDIRAGFWKTPELKRLPYLRGDVVAMIVDHAIRTRSNGKQSLDDLMRALVRDAKSHRAKISTDSVLESFAKFAGPDVAARLRPVVVDGATPVLEADTFAPCFTLEERDVTPFELGFDFARTRENHAITGLVPGSAAARAGLQEGQKVANWSVNFGDASRPVVLTMLEDGAQHEITFEPKGAAVRAPQISAVASPAPVAGSAGPCRGL